MSASAAEQSGFVHLGVRSHFSLLSALGTPQRLAAVAAERGFSALGMADAGNMHGALDFYQACQKHGIKPILGLDTAVAPRGRADKESVDVNAARILLFAENNVGYQNLLALASRAHLEGFFAGQPRVDKALLKKHSKGLIAVLAHADGPLTRALQQGATDEALADILAEYAEIFPQNNGQHYLYHEVCRRPANTDFGSLEKEIIRLSAAAGVPLLASGEVMYTNADDAPAHDVLTCIKDTAQRSDPGRNSFLGEDFSLKTAEQMQEIFADLPPQACAATTEIAQRAQVDIPFGQSLLPPFPLPSGFDSPEEYLQKVCEEGFQKRYGFLPSDQPASEASKRLAYELGVIAQMGFPSYFLIVWDVVKWAKDQEIAVGPGRGSAAGSLVSYVLGITSLDPLRYGLLFERFLNPERISMPDIDIDFADDRRDEILSYTREKYGAERVVQVCTFGTLAARAAVKDVGRVLGFGFAQMNDFAKKIPERPGITLAQAHESSKELREALEADARLREVWDVANKLEGSVRHVSVHACAVVISPKDITQFVPLQNAPKDEEIVITQFSQKPIEALGLLKMDFLGLKNLTTLVATINIIKERTGKDISLDSLPLEDAKTFRILGAGRTTGVFQLESPGMRRYLRDLKPTSLEDIIAMVSLYRPGPMDWIPDFIAGKHGKKKVQFPHESLKSILEPTHGIAIYQEQILEIARVFAGFSLGEADVLRRAIGKKIASELASQREKFIAGAEGNGHQRADAQRIFDEVIEPFAGYGFNKSHAAGYAMIAYQTAYLKAHYPTEFFTALLRSDQQNSDRVALDIEECREEGITVLPPSINSSGASFTAAADREIRFGLAAIKGIGETAVRAIISAREAGEEGAGGTFADLWDMARRLPPRTLTKSTLEPLAKSGALTEFMAPEVVLEHFDRITQYAKDAAEVATVANQSGLFDDLGVDAGTLDLELPQLPQVSPAPAGTKLAWEKETLGLFVSGHPLRGAVRQALEKRGAKTIANFQNAKKGARMRLAGLLTGLRRITTRQKKNMAMLRLEDETGSMLATLFPKSYEEHAATLSSAAPDAVFLVEGKAEHRAGGSEEVSILIDRLKILTPADLVAAGDDGEQIEQSSPEPEPAAQQSAQPATKTAATSPSQSAVDQKPLLLNMPPGATRQDLQRLHALLQQFPGPTPVHLCMHGQTFCAAETVNPDDEVFVEALKGFGEVG